MVTLPLSSRMNLKNGNRLRALSWFFLKFGSVIKSEEIRALTRKYPNTFVRIYKFPWYDVLYYLIFRHEKCTQSELSTYYSRIGKKKLRISKQAAFKAIKKVRPDVFRTLIRRFAELFYRSSLVKTHKGYILLAEDGTCNELLPSGESLEQFTFVKNRFVREEADARKVTSQSAALYDVTNGLVVDFSMDAYHTPEMSIAVQHLKESQDLFAGRKVVYLADRAYGGVELFSILEGYGFNYCIRGKNYFFKKQISQMGSDDEWITVRLDREWLKRLKYDQPKERFSANPEITVRVVKHFYQYVDEDGQEQTTLLLYFTNLPKTVFTTEEIIELYSKRWDLEVSYKTLKTDYEWERFFSTDCDCELCAIYSKVLFHNITGIVRKELDAVHAQEAETLENQYRYVANITQLGKCLVEYGICRYMRSMNGKAMNRTLKEIYALRHKLKVPVRPNRHFTRWGRPVTSSRPVRFRIDGRNWPRIARCPSGAWVTVHA